jgi:hypothetical protein
MDTYDKSRQLIKANQTQLGFYQSSTLVGRRLGLDPPYGTSAGDPSGRTVLRVDSVELSGANLP